MHGPLNVRQYITMHGPLNVRQYITMHGPLNVKILMVAFTFKFQINNKKKNIFRDAVDGYGVTECSSLACLSNPCFGSATCVEQNDKWHCLCPSGYSRMNRVL